MAIYHYRCMNCKESSRSFKEKALCKKCGLELTRNSNPPNMSKKEILDNSVMIRRVERLVDTDEIMRERSREDIKRKFGLK